MVNPLWLRTYCTLIEVGHFTRTAEQRHMTQSGVSQHVQKLEEQLSVTLLSRQGRGFIPTEAGERLYHEGRAVLASLTALNDTVTADPPWQGLVRVMSPGSIGLALYPRLLDLQQQHPRLAIDYRFAPNGDVESAIAESRVDLGYLSRQPSLSGIAARAVASEPLLLVTPGNTGSPDWDQLQALGFIGHPDGEHHARLLLSANFPAFRHIHQFPQRGFCNQIGMILEPVSRGLGFTVLPAHAVAAFSGKSTLGIHSLPEPVTEPLYLVWREGRVLPNRVRSVMNACDDLLSVLAGRWDRTESAVPATGR